MSISTIKYKYLVLSLLFVFASTFVSAAPVLAAGHSYAYGKTKKDISTTSETFHESEESAAAVVTKASLGDNGDVKTHNVGMSVSDQRDEPKVCGFYMDAFNFDSQQQVSWKIEEDTHGPVVLSGAITLASGNGYTSNYSLPNGMYKLYWNFDGEHGSAKHKVFKVDCEATAPTASKKPVVTVNPNTCVVDGQKSGSLAVSVTNPNSSAVTYKVTVLAATQNITVQAGKTGNVIFTDLTGGTYSATVKGTDDGTSVTASSTIATCPATPVGRGGGVVLGDTTTAAAVSDTKLTNTGDAPLATSLLAAVLLLTAGTVAAYRPRKQDFDRISL